jgi:hypothetical protein
MSDVGFDELTSGAGRIDHAPDGQGGDQTAGIQTMLDTRR